MIRSLAKILIQYAYDSSSPKPDGQESRVDRLPKWLRRWTQRDLHLQEFEKSLIRLEQELTRQAEQHIATGIVGWRSQGATTHIVRTKNNESPFKQTALSILAASLACILLAIGWFVSQSRQSSLERQVNLANVSKNELEEVTKKDARQKWLRSTVSTTKKLASSFHRKSGEANESIQRTMLEEGRWVHEAGRAGLGFVTKKLPIAAVRMVGLSSHSDLSK